MNIIFVYDLIFLFVFAALYGHKDIVQILLDNNANIDLQNNLVIKNQSDGGWTALMSAGK